MHVPGCIRCNRSRAWGKKWGCGFSRKVIADGLVKEFKDATLLLSAGGDGGPDWFTPLLPSLTVSSLRDMVIQHDEADGLHAGPRLLRNCAPTGELVLTMPSRLRHKDGKAERTGKMLLKVVAGVKEAVQPERSLVMFPLAVRVRGWRIGINCGCIGRNQIRKWSQTIKRLVQAIHNIRQ